MVGGGNRRTFWLGCVGMRRWIHRCRAFAMCVGGVVGCGAGWCGRGRSELEIGFADVTGVAGFWTKWNLSKLYITIDYFVLNRA